MKGALPAIYLALRRHRQSRYQRQRDCVINPDARMKLLLAGHMDEIGFIVHHVDDTVEAARERAREIISEGSIGGYTRIIEGWRQLPDGLISFTIRKVAVESKAGLVQPIRPVRRTPVAA